MDKLNPILLQGEIFTVKFYSKMNLCHVCIDREGHRHLMDLDVCGSLPENSRMEKLVGKKVKIKYAQPHIVCAEGVEIIEEASHDLDS